MNESVKVKVFAYGSNMCTQRLRDRVSSAEPLGTARLIDKRLVCNKKSDDGSGKANVEETVGEIVWGVLYEIESAQLGDLNNYEGGYERRYLDVITEEDSLVNTWVYVSSDLTDDPRPYDWYKELMVKGACEHRLPELYIEFLKQIESKPDLRYGVKHL